MNRKSKLLIRLLIGFIISAFILTLTIVVRSGFIFSAALILWIWMLIYTLGDVKKHIVLICYLLSFFVFLFGRELCFSFLGLDRYYLYLQEFNNMSFWLIVISLIFLWIGYVFADKTVIRFRNGVVSFQQGTCYSDNLLGREEDIRQGNKKRIRIAAQIAYYFCLLFSFADIILQIQQVQSVGYLGSYVDSNVSTPTLLGYFSSFTVVALCIYLGTCPSKLASWIALLCYEIYGCLTMLTGHRYAFIAISMIFICYIVYRHRKELHWISRGMIIGILIAVPFIIILMNMIDLARLGQIGKTNGVKDGIIRFLDAQGGSVNIINRIFYYQDQLKDMSFTSFSNTRTVLFENAIARRLFNIQVYSGNSIENAMNGHYLSHRLSYLEYGSQYLSGRGVGSCYIAELFHDFGYIGLILGNLVYGFGIRRITDLKGSHYIRNGLLLASQYFLFLSPRGDFDGVIGGLFTVTSILGMAAIILLSYCFRKQREDAVC